MLRRRLRSCKFTSHVCNVGSKIVGSKKTKTPNTDFSAFFKKPLAKCFFLKMTDEKDVICEINKLKTKESAGHDEIKPSLLTIAKPFTDTFNKAIPVQKKMTVPIQTTTGLFLCFHKLKKLCNVSVHTVVKGSTKTSSL